MSDTQASAIRTAVLEERARIARELHDSVAQTLYAISLGASRARTLLQRNDTDQGQSVIEEVMRLASAGQAEVRALLTDIRSDEPMFGGLAAALEKLVSDVRARHALEVRLSVVELPTLPAQTAEALVLIAREALHNVAKHAAARRVDIVLERQPEQLIMLITDDGRVLTPRRRAQATSACNQCANAPARPAARSRYSVPWALERVSACPFRCAGPPMDELQRLVNLYRARSSTSAKSKLDVLMDLERVRDPRVAPFLVELLQNRDENIDVRMHVLRQLRTGTGLLVPSDRPAVAQAMMAILADRSIEQLRLPAALALGDFTDIDGVLSSLSRVALADDESIDLRYTAFTAIESAGPTAESIAELRQIARDETLGNTARSVLSAWHVN
jgi:two-component sensor histidine kinase